MVLHIVNKSPSQSDALDSCISRAETDSAILLIEDGVYALFNSEKLSTKHNKLEHIKVYALAEDVASRNVTRQKESKIELVDYPGFVALTEQYESSLNWY